MRKPWISLVSLAVAFASAGASAGTAIVVVTRIGSHGIAVESLNLAAEELAGLPQVSFNTRTFWTDGVHAFTGPSFGDVAALGAGPPLGAHVVGLEGDAQDLVPSDSRHHGAILAVWLGGEPMRIRDKGPFWVVFSGRSQP